MHASARARSRARGPEARTRFSTRLNGREESPAKYASGDMRRGSVFGGKKKRSFGIGRSIYSTIISPHPVITRACDWRRCLKKKKERERGTIISNLLRLHFSSDFQTNISQRALTRRDISHCTFSAKYYNKQIPWESRMYCTR